MEHPEIHEAPATDIDREDFVFHKIIAVRPLKEYKLEVTFAEGVVKIYDVNPLFSIWEAFCALRDEPGLFELVDVEPGGYAVSWNDEIDLSSEEIWHNTYIT